MKSEFFELAMTAMVCFLVGMLIGSTIVNHRSYTKCLEKGLSLETCKELRI